MIVPEFVLTESEIKYLQGRRIMSSRMMVSHGNKNLFCYEVADRDSDVMFDSIDMLNESKEADSDRKSFAIKSVTVIYNLIRVAKTNVELSALTASVIGLYSLNAIYAHSLMGILRSKSSSIR